MAKKPSFLQRALDKVKSIWRKEEKSHPPPTPESPKEKKVSWIKRKFSSLVEGSPWQRFRKAREKELKEELRELKREKDFPEVDVGKVIPIEPIVPKEEKPTKLLIEEPEFAGERYKARKIYEYIRDELISFAKEPPATYLDLDHGLLADGSLIVQAKFMKEWDDYDDYRLFMIDLQNVLYEINPVFPLRVSIVHQFDPSKIGVDYEMSEEGRSILIRGNKYNLFKGLIDIPQNVSIDIPNSFSTAIDNIGPLINESLGIGKDIPPEQVSVRIVWGETLMRISRDAIRI